MYFEIQIKNEMKYILLVLVAVTSINAQNGIVKTYYADGTPRSEISYVNDVLDGTALYYYPNGNLYRKNISATAY
jgi:antitoxin component YwqK of YwqJK toxin-antitoxin module